MSAGEGYTKGMGFVPPMSITLSNMVSNVPASTLLPWAVGTSYPLDAEIIDPLTGMIYRSLLSGNVGNDPLTAAGKWQERGVENRLRMFDGSLKSGTEHDDLIEVVITPGRVVTDLQLMGVVGDEVQVLMNHPVDGLVFDSTVIKMLKPSGNSHWGYFFTPLESRTTIYFWPLPAYVGATLTIRILRPGRKARCDEVILGRSIWLGNTQWRPSLGFDDWSQKKRDAWGGWTVEEGDYSDRMKLQVLVEGKDYGRTKAQIVPYRSKRVLWIGARGVDGLTVLGYITSFDLVPFAVGNSDCSMTIEGLEQ